LTPYLKLSFFYNNNRLYGYDTSPYYTTRYHCRYTECLDSQFVHRRPTLQMQPAMFADCRARCPEVLGHVTFCEKDSIPPVVAKFISHVRRRRQSNGAISCRLHDQRASLHPAWSSLTASAWMLRYSPSICAT